MKNITVCKPNTFNPADHWYPKALNAQIHPTVDYFMHMDNERIAQRYARLNPTVNLEKLISILAYKPKYFKWSGADLMHTTTHSGRNQMIVIEVNSCPSGQKSFPLLDTYQEQGGYQVLMRETFAKILKKSDASNGKVAVLYDKNPMENRGYAKTIADVLNEDVLAVEFYQEDQSHIRINSDDYLEVFYKDEWIPLRAAFRYVTQKPWNRVPLFSKTKIFNPVICCLAGGRNKLVAAKAYDIFNSELEGTGLRIYTPETIWDVSKNEIPLWVKTFNYKAVVKIPYSNAGQGVFTITSKEELDQFMKLEFDYKKYIVQNLVGHGEWFTNPTKEDWFQIGTIPNKKNHSYVFDVRMMVHATKEGLRPLALYSRKANTPLVSQVTNASSAEMLMTNLSIKNADGSWDADVARLLLMDVKDFNKLGVSSDDLIKGYIQTVLAMIAIDKMAKRLVSSKKTFKRKLFKSLNDDDTLLDEIL